MIRALVTSFLTCILTTTAGAALRIETVRTPRFVTINFGVCSDLPNLHGASRQSLIERTADKLVQASATGSSEIVVLQPVNISLAFNRLAIADQQKIATIIDGKPNEAYENAVATLLSEILSRARSSDGNALFSVAGLPFEASQDNESNRRYAAALDACSAIVSTRSILLSTSTQDEPTIVAQSLSQALNLADGRPIYYSCNGQWRRAVVDDSPTAVHSYPPQPDRRVAIAPQSSSNLLATTADVNGSLNNESKTTKRAAPARTNTAANRASGKGGNANGRFHGNTSRGSIMGGSGGGVSGGNSSKTSGSKTASPASSTLAKATAPTPVGAIPKPPVAQSAALVQTPTLSEACTGIPPLILVGQTTSATIKAMYSSINARDVAMIYDSDIDPNHTGFFTNIAGLLSGLDRECPPDHTGPICIDWEGAAIDNLSIDVDEATLQTQILEYVKVIDKAREFRPHAQIGVYSLPRTSCYPFTAAEEAHAAKLQAIYDASDCIFPQVYRYYPADHQYFDNEQNLEYVRRSVRQSLMIADGKPVYPFVSHRYHNWYAPVGCRLIPTAWFKEHVAAIFEAEHNGQRAAGVTWWGADQFGWWVATHPDEYEDGPWMAEIFADEMAPGETAQQFFNRTHKRTLKTLAEVVQKAPMSERPALASAAAVK